MLFLILLVAYLILWLLTKGLNLILWLLRGTNYFNPLVINHWKRWLLTTGKVRMVKKNQKNRKPAKNSLRGTLLFRIRAYVIVKITITITDIKTDNKTPAITTRAMHYLEPNVSFNWEWLDDKELNRNEVKFSSGKETARNQNHRERQIDKSVPNHAHKNWSRSFVKLQRNSSY